MFRVTFYNPASMGNTGEYPSLFSLTGPHLLTMLIAANALRKEGYRVRVWTQQGGLVR